MKSTENRFKNWPHVQAKELYHVGDLEIHELGYLEKRGWIVIDIRVLPNESDGDRATCLKNHLEGIRMGTIMPVKEGLRHLELEAKIYGLISTKIRPDEVKKAEYTDKTIDDILSIGKDKEFSVQWLIMQK